MSESVDRPAMVSDVAVLNTELRQAMQSDIAAAKLELRQAMQSDITAAKSELKADLRAQIKREGRRTRRYFEVMVERVEAVVKIVAEVNAHHATVLDNHEARLKSLERRP